MLLAESGIVKVKLVQKQQCSKNHCLALFITQIKKRERDAQIHTQTNTPTGILWVSQTASKIKLQYPDTLLDAL